MIIYGSIGSRAARCLWTAEEIGVAYEWQPTNALDGSNKKPEYLAINPSGKIPALSDGEVVMSESLAINMYLAQTYGQGGLWPDDRKRQAAVLQWAFWSATEIEFYIGALFPQLVLKTAAERDQVLVDRLLAEMLPKFVALNDQLAGKEYVLGDFTLADINASVHTFTLMGKFGIDFSAYPNVRDWTNRCRARPARQKIESLAARQPNV
jgi:glutathione S-transferase